MTTATNNYNAKCSTNRFPYFTVQNKFTNVVGQVVHCLPVGHHVCVYPNKTSCQGHTERMENKSALQCVALSSLIRRFYRQLMNQLTPPSCFTLSRLTVTATILLAKERTAVAGLKRHLSSQVPAVFKRPGYSLLFHDRACHHITTSLVNVYFLTLIGVQYMEQSSPLSKQLLS